MPRMRLDKLLADEQCGSRKEVGAMIRAGRVCVDGIQQRDPGTKVDTDRQEIEVDGRLLALARQNGRYIMLHKPAGVLTATEDAHQPTVLSLLPEKERKGLFPVGRLDKDVEGLLLLTDDGQLGHALTSPRRKVDKVYLAQIEGEPAEDAAERFRQGIILKDGTKCRPARYEPQGRQEGLISARITVQEGRFRQVKRMVLAVGGRVVKLRRLSMGTLMLDEKLAPGEWRNLTEEEWQSLVELCGLSDMQKR